MSSTTPLAQSPADQWALLADERCRLVLAVLDERGSTSISALATAMVEREDGTATEERESIITALRHVHLPKLEAEGVLSVDADGAVTPKESQLYGAARLDDGVDGDVVEALADERRQILLSILDGADGTFSRADLARRVAAIEAKSSGTDDDRPDSVLTSLHHRHLPILDEAGIVEYDTDTGAVSLAESPPSLVAAALERHVDPSDDRFGGPPFNAPS